MPISESEKKALILTGVLLVLVVLAIGVLEALRVSLILAGAVGVLVVVVVMLGELIGSKYPRYRVYFYALSVAVIILIVGFLAQNPALLGLTSVQLEQAAFESVALAVVVVALIGLVIFMLATKKGREIRERIREHMP